MQRIAMRDQTTAAARDLVELASATYKGLRAQGVPRALSGELVRDVIWAAMTGGQPRR